MQLEALHSAKKPMTAMTYEDAIQRAEYAASFVVHPYWRDVMSRMLSGTIQSETESILAGDDHAAVNRASVGICRKVLQAPHFDIEQGRVAEATYEKAKLQYSRNRRGSGEASPREV